MTDPTERWLKGPADYLGDVQFPCLDEFIATNVDIHFEAMGAAQFWMLIRDRETGREWHLNCGAVNTRAKGYALVEEDSR